MNVPAKPGPAPAKPAPKELNVLLDGLSESRAPQGTLIHGLAGHSGEVSEGDLFAALRGGRHDGLDFLPEAVARGAVAAVCETPAPSADVPVVRVRDLTHRLGVIAGRFFACASPQLRVVAVTGTDGKTSTSHLIAEALQLKHGACGLIGTLGCGRFGALHVGALTTPDAVTLHRELYMLRTGGVSHAVVEASSHGLAQGRLVGVEVDVAVFTNLGRDHLDYHGSLEEYAAAKEKLFAPGACSRAVINVADPFGRELAGRCRSRCEVTTYSLLGGADVVAENVESAAAGVSFRLRAGAASAVCRSRLLGRFNAANLLAAAAALIAQGTSLEEAAALLERVHPVRGRMQRVAAAGACAIVDYAHTPQALENLLRACREITAGKLFCVFGCGGDRDRGKRPLMGEVASRLADVIVVTDDNPRSEDPARIAAEIRRGAAGEIEVIHDRGRAIRRALSAAAAGDCVVVAGKGHETSQLTRGGRVAFDDAEAVRRATGEAA